MAWHTKSVSVVLPTYNEKNSIASVIQGFYATGYVDEVVVVNNNAIEGTDEEVAKTPARIVREPRQGFGFSVRRGLSEARGDLIVLSEPDGTFAPKDIIKLLAFADDFDFVLGTRTTRELIWEGANMGWFLRFGNYCVAKLIEMLFNTPSLSDVGCTMRLIRRESLRVLEPHFTVGGSQFNPEMVILAKAVGLRFVEVPLNYQPRVGRSSVTGNKIVAFRVGVAMLLLIAKYRITTLIRPVPSRVPNLQ